MSETIKHIHGQDTHEKFINFSYVPVHRSSDFSTVTGYLFKILRIKAGAGTFKTGNGVELKTCYSLRNYLDENHFYLVCSTNGNKPSSFYLKREDGERFIEALVDFNEQHTK